MALAGWTGGENVALCCSPMYVYIYIHTYIHIYICIYIYIYTERERERYTYKCYKGLEKCTKVKENDGIMRKAKENKPGLGLAESSCNHFTTFSIYPMFNYSMCLKDLKANKTNTNINKQKHNLNKQKHNQKETTNMFEGFESIVLWRQASASRARSWAARTWPRWSGQNITNVTNMSY